MRGGCRCPSRSLTCRYGAAAAALGGAPARSPAARPGPAAAFPGGPAPAAPPLEAGAALGRPWARSSLPPGVGCAAAAADEELRPAGSCVLPRPLGCFSRRVRSRQGLGWDRGGGPAAQGCSRRSPEGTRCRANVDLPLLHKRSVCRRPDLHPLSS